MAGSEVLVAEVEGAALLPVEVEVEADEVGAVASAF